MSHLRVNRQEFTTAWNNHTLTTDQIAALVGCHRSTVTGIGKRFGLTPRKRGMKPRQISIQLFVRMWDFGVRASDIAAHFGFDPNHVSTKAKRLGLASRQGNNAATAVRLTDFLQAELADRMARDALVTRSIMMAQGKIDRIYSQRGGPQ